MTSESDTECECGWTTRAVTNEDFPVTWDERMQEFHLVLRNGGMARLQHSPWCGGKLVESKRDAFFTVPTEADIDDVADRMADIKNADQMHEALGEPSDTSHRAWQNQYRYAEVWKSLDLIIHEYDDGHLQYGICGKSTEQG